MPEPTRGPAGERSPASGLGQAQLYLARQAASPARYLLEQSLQLLAGWVPTLVGIGLRAAIYRAMLRMDGLAAIERNVRLRFASHIRLGQGSYLDEGVYVHACPAGCGWAKAVTWTKGFMCMRARPA